MWLRKMSFIGIVALATLTLPGAAGAEPSDPWSCAGWTGEPEGREGRGGCS